ncbi:Proteasome subunit beta type-1 [Homalodisca vitripennis]|nr:Proteasome subunit beta type-1 [Homalodisca vitripennis]
MTTMEGRNRHSCDMSSNYVHYLLDVLLFCQKCGVAPLKTTLLARDVSVFYFLVFLSSRTTVAIAGPDFCVIASDTRLGTGYSILTREQPKLFRLSSTTVLGSSGCWCDTLSLSRLLEARLQTQSFALATNGLTLKLTSATYSAVARLSEA